MMKITNFQGELTDISAKKVALAPGERAMKKRMVMAMPPMSD